MQVNRIAKVKLELLNIIKCGSNKIANIFVIFIYYRYLDGTHYLEEKYNVKGDDLRDVIDLWFNVGIAYVFPGILLLINFVLYLIPLPAFIKAKFR